MSLSKDEFVYTLFRDGVTVSRGVAILCILREIGEGQFDKVHLMNAKVHKLSMWIKFKSVM